MKEEKRWLSLLAGFDQETDDQAPLVHPSLESASANDRFGGYFYAVLICALMSIMALALRDLLDPANLIMLYLVGVVGVALKFGRKPAILASFLSVLAFDFFLVPPYHSLTVEDTQYLLTFSSCWSCRS
jgi:K+-sensing histidine kinase KdpD